MEAEGGKRRKGSGGDDRKSGWFFRVDYSTMSQTRKRLREKRGHDAVLLS
jgi:hypothetical protein